MFRILANDGIDAACKKILEEAGFEVVTDKVPNDQLVAGLAGFDAILVRSATEVRKEHIDANPGLKLIGRGGVGMDNIDVDYAREKGLHVINTPEASSDSVAELVFAHMFTMARRLHESNRNMPECESTAQFNQLKKLYSTGFELKGKTLGIIGLGKIGQSVARMALALGMNVKPYNIPSIEANIEIDFMKTQYNTPLVVVMKTVAIDELLSDSDFITLHVPFSKGSKPILGAPEFVKMKNGVCIINTSRGGAVSESDLLEALQSGKVGHAAMDVFEGEPLIREEIRKHPRISLSPHIGGSTVEAQERIGVELANKVVQLFT